MLTFRKMTDADIPAVSALIGELHALHAASRPDMYVPVADPYAREEYEKRASSADWISLVAEDSADGGKLVAVAFVELRARTCMVNAPSAYMYDICVREDCRRQKIGTMLYRMAEREARLRGARRLDLCVWAFNEPAAAFYRKMGFAPQRIILEKDITTENFESECCGKER